MPRTKNKSIKTIKSAIALKITVLPTGVFPKQLKQFETIIFLGGGFLVFLCLSCPFRVLKGGGSTHSQSIIIVFNGFNCLD